MAVKPKVLSVCLRKPSATLEVFLYTMLRPEFEVMEVTREQDALRELERRSDCVASKVLLTDGAIASEGGRKIPHKDVRSKVQQFLKEGGTVICCGFMPNDASPWQRGDYFRSTFELNPRTCLGSEGLPAAYSMKASHLCGVNPHNQALYTATEESCVESLVSSGEPIDLGKNEFPAAFTKVPDGGHVGYIGDVNSENPTSQVLLAMCRYAGRQKASSVASRAPSTSAAQQESTATGGPVTQAHVCLHCGVSEPRMRRCGGCRKVYLCSEECQRAAWPQHKLVCKNQRA